MPTRKLSPDQREEPLAVHTPEDIATNMADAMGIEPPTEDEYRKLQQLGEPDTKTSSWVLRRAGVSGLDEGIGAMSRGSVGP